MDPNQVVPDQLPDENYIERLFPKCPPKQVNMYSSSSSSVNNNKKSFKTSGKDIQRKQTRSKVQQHSRRELEARRNKIIKSSHNNDNIANSSETSDDNNNDATDNNNNNNNSNHNNSNNGHRNSKKGLNPNTNLHKQTSNSASSRLPQNSLSSSNNSNALPSRKPPKYTASQSLLQQLKRSQSSYSSNTNSSLDKQNHNPPSNHSGASDKGPNKAATPYYESRGIVKSTSSYVTFSNEPSDAYQSQASQPSSSSLRIQFQQQLSRGCLDESLKSSNNSSVRDDNIPSDMLENNCDYSGNVTRRPSILRNPKRDILDNNSNTLQSSNIAPKNNDITQRQISRIDNHSELINIKSGSDKKTINGREMLETISVNSSSSMTTTNSPVLCAQNNMPCVSAATPSFPLSNQATTTTTTSTTTADLNFRNKNDHLEKEHFAIVNDNITNSPLISNQTTVSRSDKSIPDVLVNKLDENAEPTRRGDDKYINLFVYDNATQHQQIQKSQLFPTVATSPSFVNKQSQKLQQLQQCQGFPPSQNKGSARYRPQRVSRFSDKANDSGIIDVNDESFESTKDNIEITEIIEEEDYSTQNSDIAAVPTSTEIEEEILKQPSPPSLDYVDNLFSDNLTNSKHQPYVEKKSPNIISVHHQASQQLLTTSDTNENDDNVIRNDASTEELCSTNESIEEDVDRRKNTDAKKNQIFITPHEKQQDEQHETSDTNTSNKTQLPIHHKALAPISTLQTVDERAEINIESELKVKNQDQDKIEADLVNDKMATNQSGSARKSFVPPGYPQRIGGPKQSLHGLIENHSAKNNTLIPERGTSKQSIGGDPEMLTDKIVDCNVKLESNQLKGGRSDTTVSLPRVKFDEDNLVTVRGDFNEPNVTQGTPSPSNNKLNFIGNRRGTDEHIPQMPSISENLFESEIDATRSHLDAFDRDLSMDLSKISLVSHSCNQNGIPCDVNSAHQDAPDNIFFQQQQQAIREKIDMNIYHPEPESQQNPSDVPQRRQQQQQQQEQHRISSLDSSRVSQAGTYDIPPATTGPNLRHHKLPNESSHYSIVRSIDLVETATNSTTLVNSNSSASFDNNLITRSSSLRFNTLSDNESGPEDSAANSNIRQISNGSSDKNFSLTTPTKKCDSILTNNSNTTHNNLPGTSSIKSGSSSIINEDDMMPTTKTALIFPRLDEGLSSEAESCDDEVEEDDERAVDADVDADDDDDDEDDDDDDDDDDDEGEDEGEKDALPTDKNSSSLRQAGVECFPRQQQSKTQHSRLTNTPQQHSPLGLVTGDQTDLHQVKAPGSTYGGYIGQDPLEHNDLKTMTNYPNQNGQSNYWMGITGHQQSTINSTQSSSSQQQQQQQQQPQQQQFMQRTNHGSNTFNRDEGKISNRLSSDTDNETDRLLGSQRNDQLKLTNSDVNGSNSTDLQPVSSNMMKQNASSKEVLIEGVLFNVKYLGSTHSDCEGRSEKEDRIHQAEMAVQEVKFRNGESQSATEVQLFISTEKIMVLDDKHRKILMDHSLRTISYIADIGDAIVLIVRKKNSSSDVTSDLGRPISKISCHVFESIESHTITKSISQAFQVAYTELLKANGTGDTSSYLPKELDYQEVLNSQEMSTDELEMFARKENQREVIVPKEKGEILGMSIVESGWGSVLPTVVIANLKHDGPAYRCKRLSIGDQILSVNGISLVGLPLAECQEILRRTKNQRVARLSVVPCPITVEVKIKRPDTKYQLGFSVQNGVICSLLRGGIAERGGVRVGHRIMSINGTTVVGVPHEKIVTLLASSVGEIRMKTCLTSLYRLILGEENPVHF